MTCKERGSVYLGRRHSGQSKVDLSWLAMSLDDLMLLRSDVCLIFVMLLSARSKSRSFRLLLSSSTNHSTPCSTLDSSSKRGFLDASRSMRCGIPIPSFPNGQSIQFTAREKHLPYPQSALVRLLAWWIFLIGCASMIFAANATSRPVDPILDIRTSSLSSDVV